MLIKLTMGGGLKPSVHRFKMVGFALTLALTRFRNELEMRPFLLGRDVSRLRTLSPEIPKLGFSLILHRVRS